MQLMHKHVVPAFLASRACRADADNATALNTFDTWSMIEQISLWNSAASSGFSRSNPSQLPALPLLPASEKYSQEK